jgi:hypothetical protein
MHRCEDAYARSFILRHVIGPLCGSLMLFEEQISGEIDAKLMSSDGKLGESGKRILSGADGDVVSRSCISTKFGSECLHDIAKILQEHHVIEDSSATVVPTASAEFYLDRADVDDESQQSGMPPPLLPPSSSLRMIMFMTMVVTIMVIAMVVMVVMVVMACR